MTAPSSVPALAASLHVMSVLRSAEDGDELTYAFLNECSRVVPYTHAFLWREGGRGVVVEALSGAASADPDAPFCQLLARNVRALAAPGSASRGVLDLGGHEGYTDRDAVLVPLARTGGGAVFTSKEPLTDGQAKLVEILCDCFDHARDRLRRPKRRLRPLFDAVARRPVLLAAAVLACAAAAPYQQSVIVPARFAAVDGVTVSSAADGVVRSVLVAPNQVVEAGQPLVVLDDAVLRAELAGAEKELASSEAEYDRARQAAFLASDAARELTPLKARVEERAAQRDLARARLAQATLSAPQRGVAVFKDRFELMGRAVRAGERIMVVADAETAWVETWIPADEPFRIDTAAPLEVFANTDPMRPVSARVEALSYEAEKSPQGIYGTRVAAVADAAHRTGTEGQARVYGGETTLLLHVLRKPVAWLRLHATWP